MQHLKNGKGEIGVDTIKNKGRYSVVIVTNICFCVDTLENEGGCSAEEEK